MLPDLGAATLPNLDRLIEDLSATLPLFDERAGRGRPLHPSVATLERLGERFIGDDQHDERARWLRRNPWVLQPIVTRPSLPILFDTVRLSYFLAAIVYARRDMREAFARGTDWDWEAALQWLVLYGIDAHALWLFLPPWFIRDLLRPTIRRHGSLLTPLQLCLLCECPAMARDLPQPDQPEFAPRFEAWMAAEGVDRFNLFWLRSLTQLTTRPTGAHEQDGDVRARPAPVLPAAVIRPGLSSPPPATTAVAGNRKEYGSFGMEFPAVRVTCDAPHGVSDGTWRGFARPSPDGTVDLAGSQVWLQLPTGWLPASVMLLELSIATALWDLMWVQVSLDGQAVDIRSSRAYAKGRPVKVLIPTAPRSASPVLDLQFAFLPEAFAALAQNGGVFARLHSLQFWRLR